MTDNELKSIIGGAYNISASFLNQLVRGATFLLEMGRSLGGAIRRIKTKKLCG